MSEDVSACTWSIEVRPLYWMNWAPELTRLSREVAEEQVVPKQRRNPFYLYRLLNEATGELVHIDAQGQPIPAEPVHHGRTRSVEDEMADRMGDRFEAARDPEWGTR